ncbi:MAG: hypothetical protein E6G29_09225 [Actinobacteria bacterium]|nr:MAG: hypothetical protein E6G29_09225 [Actinomycetota bacterium]
MARPAAPAPRNPPVVVAPAVAPATPALPAPATPALPAPAPPAAPAPAPDPLVAPLPPAAPPRSFENSTLSATIGPTG